MAIERENCQTETVQKEIAINRMKMELYNENY